MDVMTTDKPRLVRPFWTQWRRYGNESWWCKATDGGFWWMCGVLIERMPKPPVTGAEVDTPERIITMVRDRETVAVPEQYTRQPAKYDDEAATRNYGKIGANTLLLNDDYVAHFERKGYTMRQVVGDGMEPVLFYKGDRLMGMLMPLVSPEYAEKRRPQWWRPGEGTKEVQST